MRGAWRVKRALRPRAGDTRATENTQLQRRTMQSCHEIDDCTLNKKVMRHKLLLIVEKI